MKLSDSGLKLIQSREGKVMKVYKDSLGKPTAGIGHLLKPGEEKLPITEEQVQKWFEEDIKVSVDAANNQASNLPKCTQELFNALVSVNFQLGTGWTKKFTKTWGLMLDGDFDKAAFEVENSLWAKQTPIRVRDFQRALWLSL